MQEESIKEAINVIIDALYNSNINLIDKTELIININHFLTNYEQETKSKVKKKELK